MDSGGPEVVPVFYDDFWPIHYARDVIDLASIVWQTCIVEFDDWTGRDSFTPLMFELVRV